MALVNCELDARGVATLTLNRPEKLNAFSRALCDEYLSQVDALEASIKAGKARVLILTSSSEKAFCAGADLQERAAMNESQIGEQLKIQREMMDRTAALSVPTIAVIHGVAFGGGLELALACDFRLAASGAQLGLTELRLAIIPGSGGTQRLSRLVGIARAKEMILLGQRLDASQALAMGLVNATAESLSELVDAYVSAILETGPLAQGAAKKAINEGYSLPIKDALDLERNCYDSVLNSKDRVEGLKAFLEKRKASYRGS